MKRDETDKKISALLKKAGQTATASDEWFTRRVINRLPPKSVRSYAWVTVAVYVVCLAICLAGWAWFIFSLTPGILLVKDVLGGAALLFTTVVLLWQGLGELLRTAET